MAQTRDCFVVIAPNYITPISCPHCASIAHLMRRSPTITGYGKGELRTFRCADCHEPTEMFIREAD